MRCFGPAVLIYAGVASVLPASAVQRHRFVARPMPAATRIELISRATLVEAMREVDGCTHAFVEGTTMAPECHRDWKGIKWTLFSNWGAELTLPNGVRWQVSCKYDAIDREERCAWTTGDEFLISMGDGYATLVDWGFRKYPASEMTVRFDDQPAVSTTSETWTGSQARSLYGQLLQSKVMRYRWYSWPDNYE